MAFTASAVWEIESGASDTNNGGGFDTGVAGFPTDGAATVANTSAPVFTSASYNFVAGDVGAWIYIKSGTNWIAGWYKIASVAANAATLNATIGAAVLAAGVPTTVVGAATTASPTGATWGIDYSQSTTARIAFTDMVIAVTTTNFTSAANPVGKNFVGNVISVTGGVNFSVQRVAVVSTSGTTATCDKSLGTAAAISGVGGLGGALASPGLSGGLAIASNFVFIKSGTYSATSASSNVTAGCPSFAAVLVEGYQTVRGDLGTAPILQASGISTATLVTTAAGALVRNVTADGATLTAIQGFNLAAGLYYKLTGQNCTNSGIVGLATSILVFCKATGCTTAGAGINGYGQAYMCESFANTVAGFSTLANSTMLFCLAYGNTGATTDGFNLGNANSFCLNCVSYGNGRDGYRSTSSRVVCANSIAEGNTGVGFNLSGANTALYSVATFNNSGGSTVNSGARSVTGLVVLGTSSFFINAAGSNFALNNTFGAGGAARAVGLPGTFPTGNTTGLLDIGAAQSRVPWQTSSNLSGGLIG